MLHIKEAIIVEGIYDKQRVEKICDAYVFTTGGFDVFAQKEKREFIRRLAREKGIIVLTDSDRAGFLIRNHIKNIAGDVKIKQAYIPEIYGKERRKDKPSAEGKLGVEGIDDEILREVLSPFAKEPSPLKDEDKVTKADLFEWGLSGSADSAQKRKSLCRRLQIPENISANALLEAVNAIMTKKQLCDIINSANL